MARRLAQAALEHSLLGRLVALAFAIWQQSLVHRVLVAIGGFLEGIFAGSFFGKVWYSEWPNADHAAGSAALRGLCRLGGAVDAAGARLGPKLAGLWAGSLLAALGRTCVRALGPILQTSVLYNAFLGYPAEVALAPDEKAMRPPKAPTYLLGAVLGLLPLIPTDFTLGPIPVPSPTVLMIAGIWGVALLWICHRFSEGERGWRLSQAFLPLALLLLVAAAATLQSVSLSTSALSLVIWLTAALLFFMTVNLVRTSRDAAALLGPILAGAALMTVWALYQQVVPPQIEERWVDPTTSGNLVRSFASLGNPNYLAEYMALYLPLALALWLQQPNRRLIMGLPMLLMLVALGLTYSRGGYLALLIALALFMLMRARRWMLLLILAAAGAAMFAPGAVVNRLQSAAVDLSTLWQALRTGAEIELADTSNTYRINLWIGVLEMLKHYWVLGVGLGAEAFALVYQEFMLAGARAAHAHNTYLQVVAEMGALGLVGVLWSLLAVIRRTFVTGIRPGSALLVAAVPAALVGMLFHGLVEHIWYNPKLLFAFWAVAGLGMGLALGSQEDAAL